MNLQLSSSRKKILVFDNALTPKIGQTASLIQKRWPDCQVIFVVREGSAIDNVTRLQIDIFKKKSLISIFEGFKLSLRLREMRPDIILIRKPDFNLKYLCLILMCRPSNVYIWKMHSDTEVALSEINWRKFFTKPYHRANFLTSLLCSSLPLFFLIAFLPILWLKNCSWMKKKRFWGILKNNLQQGPLGDSPWLWAWLQFVMFWVFVFDKKPKFKYPSRILVVRNDHIGDSVNTIPLIRYLRRKYPKAHIAVLCDSGQFLWKDCPYIDEILIYKTNNRLFNRESRKLRYVFRPFTYIWTLRKKRFDLVIDPVGRTETHILSYLCGNATRLSSTYYPYKLFGITIGCRHYESNLHETRRALSLVKPAPEITDRECNLEIWLKPQIQNWAEKYFEQNGLNRQNGIIGIHPGALSPLRRWPIERFATVACELAEKHNMQILFFEPPGHFDMTRKFTSVLSTRGLKASIVKGVDLLSLTALIKRCNLFLCNDSGPMHLAAAAKTPMVAIFGPGEYIRWQPLHSSSVIVRKELLCSPCSQNDCTNPKCMSEMSSQDVLQAAERLLSRSLQSHQTLNS